jgi:hypothetical protein
MHISFYRFDFASLLHFIYFEKAYLLTKEASYCSVMDKKDIMYGVLALVIILIIALVIKPLATGHPVNLGLPASETPKTTPIISLNNSDTAAMSGVVVTPSYSPALLQKPPSTATPVPTWNATIQNVGFVNPSTYGLSTNQTFANSTRVDSVIQNTSMTTFATFSGKTSGTTQIIKIPFPSWELWYTVDPVAVQKLTTVTVTPTHGSGASSSDISGSYSITNPQFTLQVMDANDPNRIVRVISPPGGINLNLWLGVTPTTVSSGGLKHYQSIVDAKTTLNTDPRPWKEKFFEGQKSYYFIIDAQNLNSYKIDIRVPTKYIGQY